MSGELGEKNLGVFTEVDHVKWRRTWRKSKGGAEERTERRQARPRWNQSDVHCVTQLLRLQHRFRLQQQLKKACRSIVEW